VGRPSKKLQPPTQAPLNKRLREFRDARGWSRDQLAAELGVTPITLYRWETGSTLPSPLAAEKLEALGFGVVSDIETNIGSVSRLKGTADLDLFGEVIRPRSLKQRAVELKDESAVSIDFFGRTIEVLPAPFVRNGPLDQAPFHRKLINMQFAPLKEVSQDRLLRSLSMVEATVPHARTAQNELEDPSATALAWNSNYGSHGWHRYVGRFPPHVVRALLNYFGAGPDTIVCDPFVGSGTTAVECRLLGIPFIGIEISSLSCLMTRVKAAFPQEPGLLSKLSADYTKFFDGKMHEFLNGRPRDVVKHNEVLSRPGNPIPTFSNVERWFTAEALLGVSIAIEYGMSCEGFLRDALLMAISAKMRSIGNLDVDVVRAEYSKKPRVNVDVKKLVVRHLAKMEADIRRSVQSHDGLIGEKSIIDIQERSVLDADIKDNSVDIIITSPPYGTEAISYLRTHLLSFRSLITFLQHDPYEVRDKTIGSEYAEKTVGLLQYRASDRSETFRNFFDALSPSADAKEASRRAGMMQFFDDMLSVGEKMAKWLKPQGRVAFIIGNKRLGNDIIPTDVIIRELFNGCGLRFFEEIKHKLKTNNSNSQVPWQERIIQEEAIILFEKVPA
jgi:DNA modification methylase/transcriptional regulator with XRE-family HTH domain